MAEVVKGVKVRRTSEAEGLSPVTVTLGKTGGRRSDPDTPGTRPRADRSEGRWCHGKLEKAGFLGAF